jgi:Protein of unknown function (DUF2530)
VLDVPPLPPGLTRVSTVIGIGTLLWLLAAAVVLVATLAGAGPPPLVLATCLVGAGLGGVGWGIFTWQRAAARRGSRTAQRGLDA